VPLHFAFGSTVEFDRTYLIMALAKLSLRICLGAVAGAVAGVLLMSLAASALAFFLGPLSPSNKNIADGNIGLGMMAGVATGAALATKSLRDAPPWLRKIVGGLAIWIGLTLTGVPLLAGLFLFIYAVIKGGLPQGSQSFTLIQGLSLFSMLLLGVAPLWLGWELCALPLPRALGKSFIEATRAVLLPRVGKDFELVTFDVPFSRTNFETQLEALAVPKNALARARWTAGLPLGLGPDVMALRTKRGFALQYRARSPYLWRIEVTPSVTGARIEARSHFHAIHFAFMCFWFGFLAIFTVVFIIGTAFEGKVSLDSLIASLSMTAMWTFGLLQLRGFQFQGRRQELLLIEWFCNTFNARIVRREQRKKPLLF
jgi:hypothetical protein